MVLSVAAAVFSLQAYAQPVRYEAESAPATCAGSIDSYHAGFSGSGFCNADNAVGAAVQFTVNAPNADTATLTIRYANGTSDNQVINLDSFGNRDPRKNGESADGLAIKEGSGTGNVVRGARLWNNSDDGFDAWEFLSSILIEDSLAWGNGFNRWNLPGFTGDGNGFKLGGGGDEDPPAAHTTRNSMAWDNAVGGFIDNANPGTLLADRCTAWRNGAPASTSPTRTGR